MKITQPIIDEIVTKLKNNQCVAFVGAGFSMALGLPNWEGLLRHLIADCMGRNKIDAMIRDELESLLKVNKFEEVAEAVRESLGLSLYEKTMIDIFEPKPGRNPTDNHKLLAQLPFATYITTNYDNLIETALAAQNSPLPDFTHADLDSIATLTTNKQRYVFKIHGTIDRPSTIVLTQSDYDRIIFNRTLYREHMRQIFRNHTVLFFGFGLNDAELKLLLTEIKEQSGRTSGPHYAFVDEQTIPSITERTQIEKRHGIQFITYPAGIHSEITDLLTTLVAEIGSEASPTTPQSAARREKSKPGISIPVVIAAMNQEEAQELFSETVFDGKPELADRKEAFIQFRAMIENGFNQVNLQERYGQHRDEWKPLNQKIDWMNSEATSAERVIAAIVQEVMEKSSLGGMKLIPESLSEDFFSQDLETRVSVRRQSNFSKGAVIVIDAISIFHDKIWGNLIASTALVNPLNALFLHSPINYNTHPVNLLLGEKFLRTREMEMAIYSYKNDFNALYEIMSGDPLTLQRWLFRVLPTISRDRAHPNNHGWMSASGNRTNMFDVFARRDQS